MGLDFGAGSLDAFLVLQGALPLPALCGSREVAEASGHAGGSQHDVAKSCKLSPHSVDFGKSYPCTNVANEALVPGILVSNIVLVRFVAHGGRRSEIWLLALSLKAKGPNERVCVHLGRQAS